MYATGHYGVALLVYAPVAFLLLRVAPSLVVLGGAAVLAVSTLPDADLRLPFVAHRGLTHTVPFLLCVSSVLAAVGWWVGGMGAPTSGRNVAGAAFGFGVGLLGVGSHLLADLLTPMGVPVFWPLSRERVTIDLTRSDNVVANWLLLALGAVASGVVVVVAVG